MMKKSEFDDLIKRNLQDVHGDIFGYRVSDPKRNPFEHYYNNASFKNFIDEMEKLYNKFYNQYADGKGSELLEKNGRYGKMPPKMASVASSSRFCYLALRNGASALNGSGDISFEHGCKIKGVTGNAPQLDAYIAKENIYVEVKCHEIFDSHKIKMREAYWNLLFKRDNDFGFEPENKPDAEYFTLPLSLFGIDKRSSMFDIKQFICHLLGIASQKDKSSHATLVYLFFKPKAKSETEQAEVDEIFDALQYQTKQVFNSAPIQSFISSNNITLKAVAESSETMEALTSNNLITLY